MRILFAQKWPYFPNIGGGSKSQRLMVEQLVRLGHDCQVVSPGCGTGYHPPPGSLRLHHVSGVDGLAPAIRALAGSADLVVLPNDDHEWTMLEAAVAAAPGRVVTIVHTIQQLPFGERAFRTDARARELLGRCAGIVCVSRAARDYLEHDGLPSTVVHPYVYEDLRGAPTSGGDAVMLVNPCAYKGIDILLGLAARLPDVPFAGVRGWATTADDVARMREHDNIEVLEPDDVRKVLARARVLLAPSLWDETFGYICVEAMLHGVPVLASRLGGLVEAKLGVPYLLPVNRIEGYYDSGVAWRPGCDVPPQDLAPWQEALSELWHDPAHHAAIAERSRAAAQRFVDGLAVTDLHDYLGQVAR